MARPTVLSIFIALTLGLLALPAEAQWNGTGRVYGFVSGPDGQPIEGARVTYRLGDEPDSGPPVMITDATGEYRYAGLKSTSWTITVEADGYLPIPPQTTFVYATMNDPLRIQMEPIPEEVLIAQKRAETNKILMKGDDLRAEGKHEEARKAYLKALGDLEEQQKPIVLAALADAYLHDGLVEEAREQLDAALTINPNHVPSLVGLMTILTEEGKVAEAEELLARIPEDEEVPSLILLRLAKEHYDHDQMEQAKQLLDRTLRDNPEEAIAYYMRGLTELNLNQVDNARADIERFLELAPEAPQADAAKDVLSYLPPPTEGATP